MKFIENYNGGPFAAICMSPKNRDELLQRLQSGESDIHIEDLFHDDSYKIEQIHVSNDWSNFEKNATEISPNVIWGTRIMRVVVLVTILLAFIGGYSVFKYAT